jgi:hypothetical protein
MPTVSYTVVITWDAEENDNDAQRKAHTMAAENGATVTKFIKDRQERIELPLDPHVDPNPIKSSRWDF